MSTNYARLSQARDAAHPIAPTKRIEVFANDLDAVLTHYAALSESLAKAHFALRIAACPRPINTSTDDSTKWCVENGHCGCGRSAVLQPAPHKG